MGSSGKEGGCVSRVRVRLCVRQGGRAGCHVGEGITGILGFGPKCKNEVRRMIIKGEIKIVLISFFKNHFQFPAMARTHSL